MTIASPPLLPALGICLEEHEYPYGVGFLPLTNDLQPLKMAYMDIPLDKDPNGKTVVLFHGKAFGCYYFHNVIQALTGSGYRVVAADQIGWGKSPKPDIHYSFQLLAANTAALLDHLDVAEVAVLGHSTGGMTAVRFALMNFDRVTHLVLEDPLGLGDYRVCIPPQAEETLYQHELDWTDPTVIRAYVAGYFVHPDPEVSEPLTFTYPEAPASCEGTAEIGPPTSWRSPKCSLRRPTALPTWPRSSRSWAAMDSRRRCRT
jgi:pimeloyl-ACP methyl ester carboxylesterase